eukprot:6004947-Prymnesium_polylepis.2
MALAGSADRVGCSWAADARRPRAALTYAEHRERSEGCHPPKNLRRTAEALCTIGLQQHG